MSRAEPSMPWTMTTGVFEGSTGAGVGSKDDRVTESQATIFIGWRFGPGCGGARGDWQKQGRQKKMTGMGWGEWGSGESLMLDGAGCDVL